LLKRIEESPKYVGITGFKGVKVGKPELLLKAVRSGNQADVEVQFFNADLIATWEHLYFAVVNALMAFDTKRNISKNLAVEIMLYGSAQRQIQKAIELLGVKPGCSDVAVVVVAEAPTVVEAALRSVSKSLSGEADDHVLDLSPQKVQTIRTAFTIADEELMVVAKKGDVSRALVDLIIERMALLSTRL
jgi:KEOPS complex subunit Cgi121